MTEVDVIHEKYLLRNKGELIRLYMYVHTYRLCIYVKYGKIERHA